MAPFQFSYRIGLVSIGTYFFRHDFRSGKELERSDSESDTRCKKTNGNTSGTITGYDFEFK